MTPRELAHLMRAIERPEPFEASALHEAGHAVVAAGFGYPIVAAGVLRRAGSREATGVVLMDTHRFGRWRDRTAWRMRCIDLAGPLAALALHRRASLLALSHHRLTTCPAPMEDADVLALLTAWRFVVRAVAALLLAHRGAMVGGRAVCERVLAGLGIAGTVETTVMGPSVRGVAGWLPPQSRPVTAGYWIRTNEIGAPFRTPDASRRKET